MVPSLILFPSWRFSCASLLRRRRPGGAPAAGLCRASSSRSPFPVSVPQFLLGPFPSFPCMAIPSSISRGLRSYRFTLAYPIHCSSEQELPPDRVLFWSLAPPNCCAPELLDEMHAIPSLSTSVVSVCCTCACVTECYCKLPVWCSVL